MAVLINEFEVVVEPPATSPSPDADGSDDQARDRVLSPYEVVQLMMHSARRMLRVTAD